MDQYTPPVIPNEMPAKKKNPWIISLIIVVVLVILCCCCLVAIGVVVPALLGPSVGNVFSSIQKELITPVP